MANFATMGQNRVPRILFFILGMHPTDEQKEEVARFGPNVGIRNALQVASLAMSPLEECDAVAGDVPDRYAAVYPNVNGMGSNDRLLRMSDLDRAHGPVHALDNEAARAAKPPSIGADFIAAQGAARPAGAMTAPNGGFVAPRPGDPDNVRLSGSERAENAPEGSAGPGTQGPRANPHGLPDAGAVLPRPGEEPTGAVVTASGGGIGGFTAPEPAADEPEDGPKGKAKGKAKGDDGATGDTGAAS